MFDGSLSTVYLTILFQELELKAFYDKLQMLMMLNAEFANMNMVCKLCAVLLIICICISHNFF